MAFTTMGKLSFKVLWTYFSCEEPQWTPLHWIFGKPRNICPTIADLLQTLSLYFLLSAIVFCMVLKILPWLKKGYMYLQIFGETFRYARAIKESAETKGLSRKRKEVIVTIQLPSIYTTDLRERIPIYTTDLRERIPIYTTDLRERIPIYTTDLRERIPIYTTDLRERIQIHCEILPREATND